jgi:hypothetical protein
MEMQQGTSILQFGDDGICSRNGYFRFIGSTIWKVAKWALNYNSLANPNNQSGRVNFDGQMVKIIIDDGYLPCVSSNTKLVLILCDKLVCFRWSVDRY